MNRHGMRLLGVPFSTSFLGITFSCTCSLLAILFCSSGHSVDTFIQSQSRLRCNRRRHGASFRRRIPFER